MDRTKQAQSRGQDIGLVPVKNCMNNQKVPARGAGGGRGDLGLSRFFFHVYFYPAPLDRRVRDPSYASTRPFNRLNFVLKLGG